MINTLLFLGSHYQSLSLFHCLWSCKVCFITSILFHVVRFPMVPSCHGCAEEGTRMRIAYSGGVSVSHTAIELLTRAFLPVSRCDTGGFNTSMLGFSAVCMYLLHLLKLSQYTGHMLSMHCINFRWYFLSPDHGMHEYSPLSS